MFVFFYLGYAIRNSVFPFANECSKKKNYTNIEIILFLVAFASIEIILFFHYQNLMDGGCFLVLNSYMVVLIVRMFLQHYEIKNRFIEFIGKNSLPIYLWHVAAILIIKHIIGIDQVFIYYLANVTVFFLEVISVLILKNIPFVCKFFFGNIQ